ncbi:MAG: DinB family protein [Candidatus Eisenbacteria bacterium]|nr:DinB family protein [Candidatus Eisenbacteria bacterium]
MKRIKGETIASVFASMIQERRLLISALDAFRDEDLDFRPVTPKPAHLLSVREIFLHLIDADRRLVENAIEGRDLHLRYSVCDESASVLMNLTREIVDREGIRKALKASWRGVERILSRPASALLQKPAPDHPTSLLTLLGFAQTHAAHHRGQLLTYLALLGRPLGEE